MQKRYRDTWFCYSREAVKLHGKYGLNGSAVPCGFEVGDAIVLYLATQGNPIVRMVLTEETFAEDSVLLPDGSTVQEQDVASVYRIEGGEL